MTSPTPFELGSLVLAILAVSGVIASWGSLKTRVERLEKDVDKKASTEALGYLRDLLKTLDSDVKDIKALLVARYGRSPNDTNPGV